MDIDLSFSVAMVVSVGYFIKKFGKRFSSSASTLPKLVLHFDVNQTILMADPAQGKTLDHVLNDILSNMAFGTVKDGTWTWNGGSLKDRFDPDFFIAPEEMNYYTFVQEKLADPVGASKEECFEMKTRRKKLKTTFTDPGQPGEVLRSEYDKMLSKMKVSNAVKNSKAAKELHIGEYHHLLPSFFCCIQELAKRGRDFRIVFRTFGIDLENVQDEWNAFCNGVHPGYPGVCFNGENGTQDLRLTELTAIFRTDNSDGVYAFVDGVRADGSGVPMEDVEKTCSKKITGFGNFYEYLKSHPCDTLGVNDDYWYWRNRNEQSQYGKLLLLDQSDQMTHNIFFDDNMDTNDALIVDARDVNTERSLPFKDTKYVYLWGVDCYGAILNDRYYVEAIDSCENNREN